MHVLCLGYGSVTIAAVQLICDTLNKAGMVWYENICINPPPFVCVCVCVCSGTLYLTSQPGECTLLNLAHIR